MRSLRLLLLAALLAPGSARAQDRFEIQVYEAEINEPLRPGVQLHLNYTVAGRSAPAYAGEAPPDRATRLTLEPAFGVTEFLELGGYLQTVYTPGDGFQYAGVKLRALGIVPRRLTGAFDAGLNVEVSVVPRAAEAETWGAELRPIFGWRSRWISAWINPIISFALSGASPLRPEFEPAARVSVNTQLGFGLGLEYYAGLGAFADGFLPLNDQTHLLFATFDLLDRPSEEPSAWSLNAGIGVGLTSGSAQRLVVKAIVGRSF